MFLTCNANLNNHLYSVLTAIPYEGVKIREKGLKINRKDPQHTPQHNANIRVVGRFENLLRHFEGEVFACIPSKIQSRS